MPNRRKQKAAIHKVRKDNVLPGAVRHSDDPFEEPSTIFAARCDFSQKQFVGHRQAESRYRLNSLLRITDYAQLDKTPWPEWNGHWVHYGEVRRRYYAGELDVITRKAIRGDEAAVVTFFKEKFAVRPGEPTVGLLKAKSAFAYSAYRDADLEGNLREEAERVIAYPFEGPNPAFMTFPPVGDREVREAYELYDAIEREYCGCEACKAALKAA